MPADRSRGHRTAVTVVAAATAIVLGTVGASFLLTTSKSDEDGGGRDGAPSIDTVSFVDVAPDVGVQFTHGAFRFGTQGSRETDVVAMMGGGVCWLDADGDGWIDLFAVNSFSEQQAARWEARGALPQSALFRNDGDSTFTDVSQQSGAGLTVRGNGCVAADLDVDGDTDLFVSTFGRSAVLWNDGSGGFSEGAADAGITAFGWYTGAAVGDVNRDGRPDLFIAGYTDLNAPVAGSQSGFPGTYAGVRDLLYINDEPGADGTTTFTEVGGEAGLEVTRFGHGLGASFADLDDDGDLDLYVANDTDPNVLYENVAWPGGAAADPAGLGFRFEERAARSGIADPNAGMGIAAGDANGDGFDDLFVTNAHGQEHAAFSSDPVAPSRPAFRDAGPAFDGLLDSEYTGWGTAWVDLDLDTDLDLVVANGGIPITDLGADAEPLQAFESLTAQGRPGAYAEATGRSGLAEVRPLNARGLAVADYDNDGDPDLAVATIGGHVVLLRNETRAGNWLEVALGGPRPGAVVTVELGDGTMLRRELRAGSSYLSSEDPRALFGLGGATEIRSVVVRWPDGSTRRLGRPAVNRLLHVPPPR